MDFKPLSDLRVVEWSSGVVGPYCARLLADLGAEVIKVETLNGGDPMRSEPPTMRGPWGEASALFAFLNAGKRSIALDVATPQGAALMHALLARSTLLIESQSGAALKALGFEPGELRAKHPKLSVLSISPFGRTGGREGDAASELTLQHAAAFAWHQATPVEDPKRQRPVAGADRELAASAGVGAAIAALWAITRSDQGGAPSTIDFSIEEFYAQILVDPLAAWLRGNHNFARRRKAGETPTIAGGIVWILPCADGWVMISPREQHQWSRWMDVMGSPTWAANDEMCATREHRQKYAVELQALMSEWSRGLLRLEVGRLAQEARVACFPISTPDDLLTNEQLRHREFFDHIACSDGRLLLAPGLPFQLTATDGASLARARDLTAPALGEANACVQAPASAQKTSG